MGTVIDKNTTTAGRPGQVLDPGFLEVGAVNGQIVVYIPALECHIAFTRQEAVGFVASLTRKIREAGGQEHTHGQ